MKSTRYADRCKLSSVLPKDVIICVPEALTVSGAPFIEGKLVAIDVQNNRCGYVEYVHSLLYEEAHILNPDGVLADCDITGVIVRDCLTMYIDYLISTLSGS